MAESGQDASAQPAVGNPTASSPKPSIWPPSRRTRDAVIQRLVVTLASPSVLSNRYGKLQLDEASAAARRIEGESFAAAGAAVTGDSIKERIRALQVYCKEISRRMLDSARVRVGLPTASIYAAEDEYALDPSATDASVASPPSESAASTVGASEEVVPCA